VVFEVSAQFSDYFFLQVKLTFEKVRVRVAHQASVNDHYNLQPTAGKEELVKLVAGARLNSSVNLLDNVPHAVLYLTTNVDSETMQDEVSSLHTMRPSMKLQYVGMKPL
jgi:hypothetical protein